MQNYVVAVIICHYEMVPRKLRILCFLVMFKGPMSIVNLNSAPRNFAYLKHSGQTQHVHNYVVALIIFHYEMVPRKREKLN